MAKIINFNKVYTFLSEMFNSDVHAKRILSISNAVLGVITSASLAVHLIGQGLASVKGTVTKHGIKQVDRLLSNIKFDLWSYFSCWL